MKVWRIFLTGIILTGLPLAAIAHHLHVEHTDVRVELPVEISTILGTENLKLKSSISRLDLNEINGADRVKVGDTVYVHLARGPERIAYPFALTREKPKPRNRDFMFSIKGQVTGFDADVVEVAYAFDNLVPRPVLIDRLNKGDVKQSHVRLVVKPNMSARINALVLDGAAFPQPVIEKPELFGLTHLDAKNMPAK